MDIQTLEREVLSLPASTRARLAHELLESLDALSPAELETLWLDEAEQRFKEHDAGLTQPISSEEVLHKARTLLK